MSGTKKILKWALVVLPALAIIHLLLPAWLSTNNTTTLSWAPPTQTVGEDPLTDLAGYNIHCWADAGRYTYTIHVEDPALTSYEIPVPGSSEYFCAISAITADGDESALSNVVARSAR